MPNPERMRKIVAALFFTAAALTLSAVLVRYLRRGELRWEMVAAGVFLFSMGLGAIFRDR